MRKRTQLVAWLLAAALAAPAGAEEPAAPQPPFTIGWKDGKTTIQTKSARLDLSNRLQVRYTHEMPEAGGDAGSFRIRRMKTKLEGWVYDEDLTVELQLNWADTANPLDDANVNYDLTGGRKALQLKAGQYKVPFGRQELTSAMNQEFVDRSIVSAEFARGRDLGLQVWGLPFGGKLDWRIGVFNGAGRTVQRNDDDSFQTDARLTWQPFGDVRYSEGDFESSDRPLFALAGQYESNERPVAAAGATPAHTAEREVVGADVVFKYKGFFFFGELFDATTDRSGALSDFDSGGFNLQAGYFVLPRKLEIALRRAELDPSADRPDDEREETGVALGLFFNKHNHKLQADYRRLENRASDRIDDELRLQYQLIF